MAERPVLRIVHGTPPGADPARAISPTPVGKRQCVRCGQWKKFTEFHPKPAKNKYRKRRRFYLTKTCRSCRHIR